MVRRHRGGEIICIGEILWDALPLGLFLGGAPFNVACHLQRLGEDVAFVSRVGDDALGREARRRLTGRGLSDELVSVDEALPTGFVEVTLTDEGVPTYDIVEPAAWDRIPLTDALLGRVRSARAIVLGSLALRRPITRATAEALLQTEAVKALDVNLRPPYADREVVAALLEAADVVKMNEPELDTLGAWFGWPADHPAAMEALARQFACSMVCVTRGADGAILWMDGAFHTHDGYRVPVMDTVGAGDAFFAGLLARALGGHPPAETLAFANRMGAFVASKQGGTPEYRVEDMKAIGTATKGSPGVLSD